MEFEQIYITYFRDVYLYICKLSNSEHIAEEITSETFFKATSMLSIRHFLTTKPKIIKSSFLMLNCRK